MFEKKLTVVGHDKLFTDDRHTLFVGSSGTGKTVFISTLALARWKGKYKVICFSLKGEMLSFGFPERDHKMVERLRDFGKSPTAFPHEVFIPFVKSKFQATASKKMEIVLPRHSDEFIAFQKQMKAKGRDYGWSQFKPFKISFKQLRVTDLMVLLQSATPSGIASMELLFRTQQFRSLNEVIAALIRLSSREKGEAQKLVLSATGTDASSEIGATNTFLGLLRLLSNLQESGFVCNESSPFKIDLEAIMKDNETITTFDLSNCEPNMGFLVFVSVLRQCLELRNRGGYPKLCLVVPELANYCPSETRISPFAVASGSSVSALTIMQTLSREGRLLGIQLLCDTQRPQDIDATVRSNFGWLAVSATQPRNVDWIAESLCPIPVNVAPNLPSLRIGYFYVQDLSSSLYAYPVVVCPTPSHHRKSGEDIWNWVYRQPFVDKAKYMDQTTESLTVQIKKPVKASTISTQGTAFDLLKSRLVELKARNIQEEVSLNDLKAECGWDKRTNLNRLVSDLQVLGKTIGYRMVKRRIQQGERPAMTWLFQFVSKQRVSE